MNGKSILRGFLGINYVRIDREVAREFGVSDGIQIGAMALGPDNKPMGPASAAGLQPGDIITAGMTSPLIAPSVFAHRFEYSTGTRHSPAVVASVRRSHAEPRSLGHTERLGYAEQLRNGDSRHRVGAGQGFTSGMEVVDVKELNSFERDLFGFESKARGALVRDVEPGSVADDAQISRGNLLVRLRISGGVWQPVPDRATFERIKRYCPPVRAFWCNCKAGAVSACIK
jgi:hypothetical protein